MKCVTCAAGVDITLCGSGLSCVLSASFIRCDTCLTYCATCCVTCPAVKCAGHTAETVARVSSREGHAKGKIFGSHNTHSNTSGRQRRAHKGRHERSLIADVVESIGGHELRCGRKMQGLREHAAGNRKRILNLRVACV